MGEINASYLQGLNARQKEAVLHFGAPLLILAGAGSGKTRVITTKIAYLLDRGEVDPESILAVAFTNKAADEMRERIRLLTPEAGAVMIKTFHSFGAWLLRRHSHLLDLPDYFGIFDDKDVLSLLKTTLGKEFPADRLKEIRNRIARAKDRCLLPENFAGEDLRFEGINFTDIYRLYQERLHASGAVDFGDLIMRSVQLLQEQEEVQRRISRRFKIILVDEYQDSNRAQFLLLTELYNGENYLCVVGDEDQSIYGFRGAELENILTFPERFPGTSVIRLEENYRSSGTILRVATAVVENNNQRLGKTLWTRREAGAPVVVAHFSNQDEEARFCANLLRDGNYAGTAILYRMNFQSRVFETLFTRLGIPFRVVGTLRFYEREEVKGGLAYLALLVNPKDEVALSRAVARPRRGIGPKTLEQILEQRDKTGNLLQACRSYALSGARGAASVMLFVELMDKLGRDLQKLVLAEVVKEMLINSGLYQFYEERDRQEHSERVRNLEELVNATMEYSSGTESLCRFLEDIGLGSKKEENPFLPAGRVTLITVHNTKGLEFDRVIITGLENGVFPHHSSTVNGIPLAGDDLEEERRLFYVGVTRARDSLYLTACRQRRVFGSFQEAQSSLFLEEIPEDALQVFRAAEESPFVQGSGVYHDDYGPGIVTRKWIEEGEPVVIVRFDSGQSGRFLLNYQQLERISRDP